MARISELGFRRDSGEPVIGRVYLSYVERLRRYVASSVVDSLVEHFAHDSGAEALKAARKWMFDRGFQFIGEVPQAGPRILRVVRFAGVAFATDEEIGVPLEEEDLQDLARCENPSELHDFLTRTLHARLPGKQAAVLRDWLQDPTCSWGFLPADAQKAASADIDFDVDESFRSFVDRNSREG